MLLWKKKGIEIEVVTFSYEKHLRSYGVQQIQGVQCLDDDQWHQVVLEKSRFVPKLVNIIVEKNVDVIKTINQRIVKLEEALIEKMNVVAAISGQKSKK